MSQVLKLKKIEQVCYHVDMYTSSCVFFLMDYSLTPK
jgi:hypothetical protein